MTWWPWPLLWPCTQMTLPWPWTQMTSLCSAQMGRVSALTILHAVSWRPGSMDVSLPYFQYHKFSNRGTPSFWTNMSRSLFTFLSITWVKMVWFSFRKKPLEGEYAFFNLVASAKGLPEHQVLLLEKIYGIHHFCRSYKINIRNFSECLHRIFYVSQVLQCA